MVKQSSARNKAKSSSGNTPIKVISVNEAQVATKGLTLIPLKLYLKGGRAKIELGLCRGKKLYDKREAIAERDVKREMERIIRKG